MNNEARSAELAIYNYLISNKREWNNCFIQFFLNSKCLVITTEF